MVSTEAPRWEGRSRTNSSGADQQVVGQAGGLPNRKVAHQIDHITQEAWVTSPASCSSECRCRWAWSSIQAHQPTTNGASTHLRAREALHGPSVTDVAAIVILTSDIAGSRQQQPTLAISCFLGVPGAPTPETPIVSRTRAQSIRLGGARRCVRQLPPAGKHHNPGRGKEGAVPGTAIRSQRSCVVAKGEALNRSLGISGNGPERKKPRLRGRAIHNTIGRWSGRKR